MYCYCVVNVLLLYCFCTVSVLLLYMLLYCYCNVIVLLLYQRPVVGDPIRTPQRAEANSRSVNGVLVNSRSVNGARVHRSPHSDRGAMRYARDIL